MNFFRNREIARSLWVWLGVGVLLTAGALLADTAAGIWTGAVWLMGMALHYGMTYGRYQRIARLSRDLDNILHDCGRFDLSQFEEGELSILQSELTKMTVRLREQTAALTRDKVELADAIADISHQVRTPLTSLRLLASLLSEEDLPAQRRLTLARELCVLLERIDWLITALLKLSMLDAGTAPMAQVSVDLRAALNRAAEPLAIPMELRGQALHILGDGEARFTGDPAWTTEAVGNLLKNCMEHTPEGGTITAALRQTAIYTELVVTDTGPGFDKEDLPHLFERFYRGKHAGEGSVGIGLALARTIVTAQNGTLQAANARTGGAEFTMRFYHQTI